MNAERDRQDAIMDCRYAKSLGDAALEQLIESWTHIPMDETEVEYHYYCAIWDIKNALGTEHCLLKEE